jgi:pilus assembly protein CpaE
VNEEANVDKKQTIYLDGLPAPAQAALLAAVNDLQLVPIPTEPSKAADVLRPSIAIISIDREPEGAFALVSTLAAAGVRVAVSAPSQDPALVLRALRAGAREFVVGTDPKGLEQAVRSLTRPTPGAASRVTAVFAPKGGVGATTLAVNLAASIAAGAERTCLVDLDLQLGDAQSFLDVEGGYSISDVLANERRLDRDLLDASVAQHQSGVRLLSQSSRLEEAEHVDAGAVAKLLAFLRGQYSHVFVDGLRNFDELSLAALDGADRVLLVVTQQVPSVRNAQRSMQVFRKLGYGETKISLVVNRFQKASTITPAVIGETVGLPVLATVANDYASLQRALHHGKTLAEAAPRSSATHDVAALAELLAGGPPRRPRGVFGRLFSRSETHGAR